MMEPSVDARFSPRARLRLRTACRVLTSMIMFLPMAYDLGFSVAFREIRRWHREDRVWSVLPLCDQSSVMR